MEWTGEVAVALPPTPTAGADAEAAEAEAVESGEVSRVEGQEEATEE